MRRIALACAACLAASPVFGQAGNAGSWGSAPEPPRPAAPATVSEEIATSGLAAAEARLASRETPTDDDLLALGAVRFLRAIEATLQTRWSTGMTAELGGMIPVLRLPVPGPATSAEPDPAAINRLFEDLLADLDAARAAFDAVPDGSPAALTLDLGDLWFDVNGNGTRDAGEGVTETAAQILTLGQDAVPPVVRFDAADAAWASAYAHLLSGVAEIILAFDPAPQVARVIEASRKMAELGAPSPYVNAYDMTLGREIDLAAMIYFALQQQPDPARTEAARLHLLDMVADNRVFWDRVAAETDNAAEWIPNDRQTSALPLDFPKGLGPQWQVVLDDVEAVLNGTKLIPHWRMRSGAGINLARLMQDPPPVDIAEWAHGAGLMPYAEAGERVGPDSLLAFDALVGGDALFFMFVVN